MGTVDIERFVNDLIESEDIYWDEEKYSYEEFKRIVTECVTKEAEYEYKMNDGEIDDWDFFEYNCRCACDRALGNLD